MINKLPTPQEHPKQPQNLPESLTEVAEVMGLSATTKLVKAYGGTRIFVPKRLGAQHKLANLLGLEQARRLSHYFGGESLSIARAANATRLIRNKDIVRHYDAGKAASSLALEYRLTERQIYTILAKTAYA